MVISAFQLGGDISAELETYNENGSPVGVSMRNGTSATWTSYDYLKNLQGDILGICSVSGGGIVTIHATYEYDPWGKLLGVRNNSGGVISDETSIALRNPLRYRGYYYDSDTGYYYLKSRYYDPQIGRFINADGYASTGQGFLGYNMFAYCLNNPILCADEGGNAANPRYNTTLLCDSGSGRPYQSKKDAAKESLNSYFSSLSPAYNIYNYYGTPSNISISIESSETYQKRSRKTRDLITAAASTALAILSIFSSNPAITAGGIITAIAGDASTIASLCDPVPEGDYDAYTVTIMWDSPGKELPAPGSNPRLVGYSAQYYVIFCDAYKPGFWSIVSYDVTEIIEWPGIEKGGT